MSLLLLRRRSASRTFDFRNGALPAGAALTRASAGTYISVAGVLSSALTDVARFTYDPVSHTLQGLLNEPQRTNLFLRSAALKTAPNIENGLAVNEAAIAAPDGTTTGNRLTEAGLNTPHDAYQTTITLGSGASLAFSGFLQGSMRPNMSLNYQAPTANNYFTAVFNATGIAVGETKVGSSSGTITASGIAAAGGSWRRAYVVGSATGANGTPDVGLATAASGNTFNTFGEPTYAGDSVSLGYAWGLQCEAATDVSSYIPTGAATVTRSADVLTLSGLVNGTYTATINRLSGATVVTGVSVVANTYAVPTDVSPLQSVVMQRTG